MTVAEQLQVATAQLASAGIDSARLDCLLLLEDATGHDRAWLLAHPDHRLADTDALDAAITRRMRHEPLAYIRGTVEFYGHAFIVTPDVLTPRPETEALVSAVVALQPAASRVLDVGCGSGCIAISVALALPGCRVTASDVSSTALVVARQNATALNASVDFQSADLLTGLTGGFDTIVTNLPYVPTDYPINQAASFEPSVALFAGSDGMNAYRRFWHQVPTLPQAARTIVCEAFAQQHQAQANLAKTAGYRLGSTDGLAQVFYRVS